MPKRKKYPKLPNGWGSIRYLGKGRRNPYAVHPRAILDYPTGKITRPPALCYTDAWIKGFTVLTAYKAGTYTPGMEKELEMGDTDDLEGLANKILADYNRIKRVDEKPVGKTFAEVYKDFYAYKYDRPESRKYSKSAKEATAAGYYHSSALYDKPFASINTVDMQTVIDKCDQGYSTLQRIKSLYNQMYTYAMMIDLTDKDYSAYVRVNKPDDNQPGVPFMEDELAKLWANQDDETVEMLLIMCYSGYRIEAYHDLQVHLDEMYFLGGVKTAAGKDRVVPIHSAIQHLVRWRLDRDGGLLLTKNDTFRQHMYRVLDHLGIEKHTPHDCRKTFSTLCERYDVRENDRKRMMGHKFKGDITNDRYSYRTVDELRTEIEKIKAVTNL